VIERDGHEIVFGDDLGFMQYRIGFRLGQSANTIEAATAVSYLWPRTGPIYFALVRPFHKLFVKYALSRAASRCSDQVSLKPQFHQ